ncbi:hypothetical protein J3458_002291 [Metarhizium acridum]|uniref:uncharacterized protein n=1 Tax=Metarhizium acridum TaxID=92637 RepID=UPI001C6D04C2|nr:hypothetical protein J3458_002291 [Metarhizium acridum]
MWAPVQLYLSQHTGYQRIEWAQIKNTFNAADASKPRGGPDGQKNLDHPKCYISSAKHDMHQEKSTVRLYPSRFKRKEKRSEEIQKKEANIPQAWIDVLSQLTNNAFRSDSWWYFPTKEDYILADESTNVGKLIASFDWGDADSTPPLVAKGLCNA